MVGLDDAQRELVAEKLCDVANLAAGALLFGQSMVDRPSLLLAATGLALWVVLIAYAVHLVSWRKP
jgi:hypothetical protein